MLILSRHRNESIMIGDDVEVVVVEPRGKRGGVRLGVKAPDGVPILRRELYEQNQARLRANPPAAHAACDESLPPHHHAQREDP